MVAGPHCSSLTQPEIGETVHRVALATAWRGLQPSAAVQMLLLHDHKRFTDLPGLQKVVEQWQAAVQRCFALPRSSSSQWQWSTSSNTCQPPPQHQLLLLDHHLHALAWPVLGKVVVLVGGGLLFAFLMCPFRDSEQVNASLIGSQMCFQTARPRGKAQAGDGSAERHWKRKILYVGGWVCMGTFCCC